MQYDANWIAFSGGLDSSILGQIKKDQDLNALTIIAKDFIGTDLSYSQIIGKHIGIPLELKYVSINEILDAIKSTIRILKGPQFDYFSKDSQKEFFSKNYKITNLTDRMGMRLEGSIIKNIVNTNIRSEGITKGAIQVPADGQPIILLTDHPTIGGYPKIANVISADYHLLTQKIPGEKILFQNVELQEAEQLYKEHLNSISEIIKSIKEIN